MCSPNGAFILFIQAEKRVDELLPARDISTGGFHVDFFIFFGSVEGSSLYLHFADGKTSEVTATGAAENQVAMPECGQPQAGQGGLGGFCNHRQSCAGGAEAEIEDGLIGQYFRVTNAIGHFSTGWCHCFPVAVLGVGLLVVDPFCQLLLPLWNSFFNFFVLGCDRVFDIANRFEMFRTVDSGNRLVVIVDVGHEAEIFLM